MYTGTIQACDTKLKTLKILKNQEKFSKTRKIKKKQEALKNCKTLPRIFKNLIIFKHGM